MTTTTGFTTQLAIHHRDKHWQDRAGWIWSWDPDTKMWAAHDSTGRYRTHLNEHDLNDYCNGSGYRPFIEVSL